jgi:hypothetical protein
MIQGFDKTRYELYDDATVVFSITIGSRTMAGTGKVLDVMGEGKDMLFFIDGVDRVTYTKVWVYAKAEHIIDILELGKLAKMILELEQKQGGLSIKAKTMILAIQSNMDALKQELGV